MIGTSVTRYPPYETMLIRATTAGRIYDGATDPTGAGSGEFSKPVIGWRAPTVGMGICQSGSYSGVRCGIKVTKTNYSYNLGGDIGIVGDGVVAEKTDRTSALGQGDSGGPSFTLAADPAKVYALGFNSAIDTSTQVTCTGYNYSGRQCAWRMIFANIQDALRVSKTDIVTWP